MYSQVHVLYPKRAMLSASPVASSSTTVSTSAVAPSTIYTASTAVDPVILVTFDVQTSDVRVRWDGTDPTSTVGHRLPAGTAYTWDVDQFNAAKFIRDSGAVSDATIFASPLQA